MKLLFGLVLFDLAFVLCLLLNYSTGDASYRSGQNFHRGRGHVQLLPVVPSRQDRVHGSDEAPCCSTGIILYTYPPFLQGSLTKLSIFEQPKTSPPHWPHSQLSSFHYSFFGPVHKRCKHVSQNTLCSTFLPLYCPMCLLSTAHIVECFRSRSRRASRSWACRRSTCPR